MNSTFAIERFCYLGNLKPVYVAKITKIDCENSTEYLKLVEGINGDQFLTIIRKCLQSKNLPRKDELWYIYAVYMSSSTKQENKQLVSNEFANLASNSDDLFMFAHYAKQLRENDKKKGFSSSVRRAINNWYETQDINNFIGSISKNVGSYGFSHRDLISLCHVNTKDNGLDTVLDYAFKSKKIKLSEDDKSLTASMKAFMDIRTYKKSGDSVLMKRLIEEKKLDFQNFPSTQRSKIENWKLILETMTYHQLIDNIFFFVEKNFFENDSFSKLCLKALNNRAAMKTENIHPFLFLSLKNRLVKLTRYSESVKQNYHSKKIQPTDIKSDTNLINTLEKLLDHSFESYESPKINTLVAINVSQKLKRQSVISEKQISCFDAAVTLALSFYKNQNKSSVYAFSATNMKKIGWKKNWNFTEASEYCTPYVTPTVLQRLILPINEAFNNKTELYDLILVIVGSATFGNPNGKPDLLIQNLEEYRNKKNPKARLVVINLRRFRPSMEYTNLQSNGMLEVCGINENTIKIIHAFALHQFN